MSTIKSYIDANTARYEEELCDFLRIASISADPKFKKEVQIAAEWVANQFKKMDLTTEIIPTSGHPLVYAEKLGVPNAPTVLIYGHYDVQPVDPLNKWESTPFEPIRKGNNIVARGATDDKGQLLTHIKGVEAWLKIVGMLPVNVKFLIEGEEEASGEGIHTYLEKNAARLACDCVVISDGSQFAPGYPAITYGLRGIAYYELRLRGPNRDLHSGSFGGGITNPANALTHILNGLIDSHGKITIPHFYDDVVPLTDRERKEFAALPFEEKKCLAECGVNGAMGEEGYTMLERRWARPTFDICGLTSGYQGDGAKTVLPSLASAKFSFRLVPSQKPAEITPNLQAKIAELCPPGIEFELIDMHGAEATVVSLESPYVEAASRAIETAFGRRPVYTREGGSIPIVGKFAEKLGADVLLIGWGQEDDNTHSPNEKFSLVDFHKGIFASAQLLEELAKK